MTGSFRIAAAAFSLALLAAAPASAQSLIAQPSATDVTLAYPESALANNISGSATVACTIGASGFLENCSLAAETPANQGFGDAAISLMRHFRYAPTLANGQRSAGAQKRLTVRFSPPETTSSAPVSRDPQP